MPIANVSDGNMHDKSGNGLVVVRWAALDASPVIGPHLIDGRRLKCYWILEPMPIT